MAKPACVCFKVRLCRCSVFSDQWTSIPGMMWEMNDMLTKSTLDQHGSTSVVPGCSNRVATKVFCVVRRFWRFWRFFSENAPLCSQQMDTDSLSLESIYLYMYTQFYDIAHGYALFNALPEMCKYVNIFMYTYNYICNRHMCNQW